MEPATNLDEILARFPSAGRDALIPMLQAVQEAQGYLSQTAVVGISRRLGIPASKVYGVATFYNQFRFRAKGRYHITVCRGTACHVKGSLSVLESVKRALGIEAGQTSRDGLFSLEVVACLGACGLAPLVCVNGEFFGGATPDGVQKIVQRCRKEAARHG